LRGKMSSSLRRERGHFGFGKREEGEIIGGQNVKDANIWRKND